ncbi:MAG: hypothetical protein GX968_05890 [Tissierellia bacterium]|nr:hypothetical protein [Tissierellia bacterium]
MDKNDKFKDIMEEFESFSPTEKDIEKINNLADAYKDKSEEDIFFEIIKINEDMESTMSDEEYERVFRQLESLRPMLNEEQLEKLDKILYILGR